MSKIDVKNLGVVSYIDAMALMMDLHQKRVEGGEKDSVLVVQHESVITRGRQLRGQDISLHPKLDEMGVVLEDADRGGLLTWRGPGQIVIYFVLKFKDYFESVHGMVSSLETVLIDFLADYGVKSGLKKDHPGIWIGQKKIASIGLRISNRVTCHGISLNVNNDLGIYQYFKPCGLSGDTMTSLEAFNNKSIGPKKFDELSSRLTQQFVSALIKGRIL